MKTQTDKHEAILEHLREIPDPELGVNIVDLGLIYNVSLSKSELLVEMTLTTPNCPMSTYLPAAVEQKLLEYYPEHSIYVNLVWTPLWSPEQITDKGRMELGL